MHICIAIVPGFDPASVAVTNFAASGRTWISAAQLQRLVGHHLASARRQPLSARNGKSAGL